MMWRWPGRLRPGRPAVARGGGIPGRGKSMEKSEGAGRAPGMGREAGPGHRGRLMPTHFGVWGPLVWK